MWFAVSNRDDGSTHHERPHQTGETRRCRHRQVDTTGQHGKPHAEGEEAELGDLDGHRRNTQ